MEGTGHYSSATLGFSGPCKGRGTTKAKIIRSLEIAGCSRLTGAGEEGRALAALPQFVSAKMAAWFVNEAY